MLSYNPYERGVTHNLCTLGNTITLQEICTTANQYLLNLGLQIRVRLSLALLGIYNNLQCLYLVIAIYS